MKHPITKVLTAFVVLFGFVIGASLLLVGCSDNGTGGETFDSLMYEKVHLPDGRAVWCIGEGNVGLSCDWAGSRG